jgi:hypothetical protein
MQRETALYNITFGRGEVYFVRKEDGAKTTVKGKGLTAQWNKYEGRGDNMETFARAMLTTQGHPVKWEI